MSSRKEKSSGSRKDSKTSPTDLKNVLFVSKECPPILEGHRKQREKVLLVTYRLADTDDPTLIDGFVESVAEAYDGIIAHEDGRHREWSLKIQRNSLLDV